jgi:hypothetical protein
MARSQLLKPDPRSLSEVELYHGESMTIDSTTTVLEACGSCHNLGGIHQHERLSSSAGVGVILPGANGSATITSDGQFSLNVNVGNGFVIGGQSLLVPNTGPHLSTAGTRGITLSGGGTDTATTSQDNTRVGG